MEKEDLKKSEKTKSKRIVYHFGFYLSLSFEDDTKDCVQFIFDDATIFHSGK